MAAPMCQVCRHPHFPDEKCSICGHAGKVNVIPKYLAKLKDLTQLRFYSAKMEEFDTFSSNIVCSIAYDVLEKECGISKSAYRVYGSDPATCFFSFSTSSLRTYALIGAAAILSAAHSIIVEDAGGGGGGRGGDDIGGSNSNSNAAGLSVLASPFSSHSSGASGGGGGDDASALGGNGLVFGSSFSSSLGGLVAPTGGSRVIILVQSLAIHKSYRGRRCTIDYLQYIVSDTISQFPDSTDLHLCVYCSRNSPAYPSLLSKSFREETSGSSFPPTIVSVQGETYIAMIAEVRNLVAWLGL